MLCFCFLPNMSYSLVMELFQYNGGVRLGGSDGYTSILGDRYDILIDQW